MDIEKAKLLLGDYVKYRCRYASEDKIYQLDSIVLSNREAELQFYAELIDISSNSIFRVYLKDIEEI